MNSTHQRNLVDLGYRSNIKALAFLYVVAVLLRVVAGLTISPVKFSTPLENDEPEYRQIASSIVNRGEYAMISQQSPDGVLRPTAFRLPIPALLFAVGLKTMGDTPAALRLVSVLVSGFSAPLLFLFALRITSRRGAWISALLGSAWPPWLVYSLTILSEPAFVPALLLGLIASADALADPKPEVCTKAGLAWGLATLIRPHGLPILLLMSALLMFRGQFRGALMVLTAFAVVIFPWSVRNTVSLGTPSFLETVGGETFLGSNNPYVLDRPELHGMWVAPLEIPEYRSRLHEFSDENDRNREQYRIAFAFLGSHLKDVPRLAIYKLVRWLTPITESKGAVRWAVLATYLPLVICVMLGFLSGRFKWNEPMLVALLWTLTLVVLCLVMWGILTRGRLLLEVIWIPWGVEFVLSLFRSRGEGETSTIAAEVR